MDIAFVASEIFPLAKTGGLADVAGSLPKSLAQSGHRVSLIMPHYGVIKLQPAGGAPENLGFLSVPMGTNGTSGGASPAAGGKIERATISRTFLDPARKIPVYLIGHEELFANRPSLYGFPDDGYRFTFFSRAAAEMIHRLELGPDVIHSHDWHTGLVPAYARHLPLRSRSGKRPATVFTIHNLMYQGTTGREVFGYSGLPESCWGIDGVEYFGQINFMKAGIVYADRVNTVSPTYAQEIQTPEFGHGLDGVLRHFCGKLSGIVNGIDHDIWDPRSDPHLPQRYSPGDHAGQLAVKRALRQEAGLADDGSKPIVSFIGRLVDQKGMDLIMPNLETILRDAQVVILGTGDPHYHRQLEAVKNHGALALFLKYDEQLAHRIYAGSDAFLMPSWFEPCGLGQLIALRYGTLPIVRQTGGLADTVRDADDDQEGGTGFAFRDYRPEQLAGALRRTFAAWRQPERWRRLVSQAMAQDFSWGASTRAYEGLYQAAAAEVR